MKRSIWTKLGIIELGALAVLWRSVNTAPLVAFERDLNTDAARSTRRFQRSAHCDREQRHAG